MVRLSVSRITEGAKVIWKNFKNRIKRYNAEYVDSEEDNPLWW